MRGEYLPREQRLYDREPYVGRAAAKFVFEKLGIRAPICANMALGEGTGAVALMPLLDMAYAVYGGMLAFSDAGIEEYKPL